MSSKIWLLLRFAVLLTAFLVQSSEGATYRDFANRHIDYPKTRAPNHNAYCSRMMGRRGMMNGFCKPTNTFINSRARLIQDICRRGGRRIIRNIFESRRRFPTITCRSTGRFPNCAYRGRQETKRVRVGCVNGMPVHFDRIV